MKAIKNIIVSTIIAINIILLGWVAASYVDIIADNRSREPQHADWNFFIMMTDYNN